MLTSCHHYLPDEEIFANRSSQAECLQQVSFNSAGGYDGSQSSEQCQPAGMEWLHLTGEIKKKFVKIKRFLLTIWKRFQILMEAACIDN